MKKILITILTLSLLNCKKQCSKPISEEFKTIYSDVSGKYGSNKTIEFTSSTGLIGNLTLEKYQNESNFPKSGCKDKYATYTNLNFISSIYAFDFELDFSPFYDHYYITFQQKFKEKDSIRTLRFSYKPETGDANFTTWMNLDEKNNRISRKVIHIVLDSLTTKYGTTKEVFHLTNQDVDGINNPYAISELYFDRFKGLLRFITVEKTIWDLKN